MEIKENEIRDYEGKLVYFTYDFGSRVEKSTRGLVYDGRCYEIDLHNEGRVFLHEIENSKILDIRELGSQASEVERKILKSFKSYIS